MGESFRERFRDRFTYIDIAGCICLCFASQLVLFSLLVLFAPLCESLGISQTDHLGLLLLLLHKVL